MSDMQLDVTRGNLTSEARRPAQKMSPATVRAFGSFGSALWGSRGTILFRVSPYIPQVESTV
jgi:hypothetical protein